MRLKCVVILLNLLLFIALSASAQNSRSDKLFQEARSYYRTNNNEDAIIICNKILKKDTGYFKAHLLLVEIYKDQDSVRLEIMHLEKAAAITKNPLVTYRLGDAYYKQGEYAKALPFFEKYKNNSQISESKKLRVNKKISSCKFAVKSIANPVVFKPVNLGKAVNTTNDEYWATPTLDGKKLIFTRLLKEGGRFQEDFYEADLNSAGGKAVALSEINTPENEGAQTLSADAKILFFTACNRSDGLGSCDIYFSLFLDKRWTKPCNAGKPLNTSSWEGQPSLSSDNRWLYFSSNRSGGKGQKDLWRIRFKGFSESGMPKWGKPENLEKINTSGNEISPFIHSNNRNFYFASDGLVGMGGFDLYTGVLNASGKVDTFKNMGYPINTLKDDIGLTINSAGDVAYFSSSRDAGQRQDIYSFVLEKELRPSPVTYIKASVTNKKTAEPLPANIELVCWDDTTSSRIEKADNSGHVLLALPLGGNYAFSVSEDGFLFYSQSIQLKNKKSITDPFILNIQLAPVEIGAEMNLYNIYFETDSFAILPESEPELNKLVYFLQKNEKLQVEIQGHTDSSGDSKKNMQLSKQRALSVVDYLIADGISPKRLQAKGYGATKPVADNASVEGRQLNRRTTIKVTGK